MRLREYMGSIWGDCIGPSLRASRLYAKSLDHSSEVVFLCRGLNSDHSYRD